MDQAISVYKLRNYGKKNVGQLFDAGNGLSRVFLPYDSEMKT